MVVGDSTLSSSHPRLLYFPPLQLPFRILLFPAASAPYYNLRNNRTKIIFSSLAESANMFQEEEN
jgi:hypothetical protein